MIGALALAFAVTGVALAAGWVAPASRAEERFALALATAPSLLAAAGYLTALLVGIGGGALTLAALPWATATLVVLAAPGLRREAEESCKSLGWRLRHRTTGTVVVALTGLVTLAAVARLFREALIEAPDGSLATGTADNLGDLPFHLAIAHGFAFGGNVPPEHVIFAGEPLRYPFLPDFLSGLLIASGWASGPALWVPSFLVVAGALLLLGSLAYRASGSLGASLLAPVILLLGGGGQLFFALRGLVARGALFDHDAVRSAAGQAAEAWGIGWKAPLISLVHTQRTTAAGLALCLGAALFLWLVLDRGSRPEAADPGALRGLAAVGILVGLLPLVFPHALLALTVSLPVAWGLAPSGLWLRLPALLLPGLAVGLPGVLWLAGGAGPSELMAWQPGWLAHRPDAAPHRLVAGYAWFWIKNLGPFVPLALLGLAPRFGLRRPLFWASWWAAFALASLLRLAPWPWDNTKVFLLWVAFGAVPAAALLARMLRGLVELRLLAAACLIWLLASGIVELTWVLFREPDYQEYSAEAVAAARALREASPTGARVVERPHFAQITGLAGRISTMGYPGHLWSHGVDYAAREGSLRELYRGLAAVGAGQPGPPWQALLRELGATFIVVDPEAEQFCACDLDQMPSDLELVFASGSTRIYSTEGHTVVNAPLGREVIGEPDE